MVHYSIRYINFNNIYTLGLETKATTKEMLAIFRLEVR